ncbi:MAG: hypothetical protein PHI28_20035 [Mangrovibacterium sp.]|nr:hypothetical protein [Mangrovibacterium sp.]
MRQTALLLLNSITLLFTLVMNYLWGTGAAGGTSVGEISSRYETFFTPAGYAFSIWGLIYLLLLAFVGYQWFAWLKHGDSQYLKLTGIWFALGNLANGFWILSWTNGSIGLSLLLISILLLSLLVLMVNLRLEIWDAPVRVITLVWWPVCIYFGWIVVATMANFSVLLVKLHPNGAIATQALWTIVMIAVACLVYVLLIYYRNMREAAFVGIWALTAIAVKQWHENEPVVYAALLASIILFIYSMSHAIKNRDTLHLFKMRRE